MEEDKSVLENVIRVVEVKTKKQLEDQTQVVRLTPTGKISHAKTRVYTQRYRKEWEHMDDFKDWLTSVPNQVTRAYCKFCSRNLHAHRLSLLKHMCTLKHQRAAVHYSKKHGNSGPKIEPPPQRETAVYDDDDDDDDDDMSYEEVEIYSQVDEEDVVAEIVQEETHEEWESDEETPLFKKIRIKKGMNQDTLAQAIARVQTDYLSESNEPIHLEMVVDSDQDDENTYQTIRYESLSDSKDQIEIEKEEVDKDEKQNSDGETQIVNSNTEVLKSPVTISESKNDSDNSKKVYFFSSGGKSYTLVKGQLNKTGVNQLIEKNLTVVNKPLKNDSKSIDLSGVNTVTASTSQNKNVLVPNTSMMAKSILIKKPVVSTHVLETSKGIPAGGLQVSLYQLQDGRWTFIHESMTTASGNCNEFSNTKTNLSTGRYKLHYDVEKYYNMKKTATIYPFIEIVFDIKDPNASYHIPLLLSPFSYSTYKDTPR